jgi:hypothetical protein
MGFIRRILLIMKKKKLMKIKLQHYEHNVIQYSNFERLSNIYELYQWLITTRRSFVYQLIYRVVVLVFTLSVFIVTIEQTF